MTLPWIMFLTCEGLQMQTDRWGCIHFIDHDLFLPLWFVIPQTIKYRWILKFVKSILRFQSWKDLVLNVQTSKLQLTLITNIVVLLCIVWKDLFLSTLMELVQVEKDAEDLFIGSVSVAECTSLFEFTQLCFNQVTCFISDRIPPKSTQTSLGGNVYFTILPNSSLSVVKAPCPPPNIATGPSMPPGLCHRVRPPPLSMVWLPDSAATMALRHCERRLVHCLHMHRCFGRI